MTWRLFWRYSKNSFMNCWKLFSWLRCFQVSCACRICFAINGCRLFGICSTEISSMWTSNNSLWTTMPFLPSIHAFQALISFSKPKIWNIPRRRVNLQNRIWNSDVFLKSERFLELVVIRWKWLAIIKFRIYLTWRPVMMISVFLPGLGLHLHIWMIYSQVQKKLWMQESRLYPKSDTNTTAENEGYSSWQKKFS